MNSKAGWALALVGLLLLTILDRLDMLVLLIPLATVLAFGFSRACRRV